MTIQQRIDHHVKNEQEQQSWITRLINWIVTPFHRHPMREIDYDLKHILASANLLRPEIEARGSVRNQETLAQVFANLKLAAMEIDFARAWNYVNLADTLMVLLVDESELQGSLRRLQLRDVHLPAPLRKLLDGRKHEFSAYRTRSQLYSMQRERADLWSIANNRISFRISIWKRVGWLLFWSLLALNMLAENIFEELPEAVKVTQKLQFPLPHPFWAISVLGLFGGIVSAYTRVPEYMIGVTSFRLKMIHFLLRMLLGAVGAVIVLIATMSVGNEQVRQLLRDNMFIFLALGITAGFSERLFLDALEKMGAGFKGALTDQLIAPVSGEQAVTTVSVFDQKPLEEQHTLIDEAIEKHWLEWKARFPTINGVTAEKKKIKNVAINCYSLAFEVEKKEDMPEPLQIPPFLLHDGILIPTDVIVASMCESLEEDDGHAQTPPSHTPTQPKVVTPGSGVSRLGVTAKGTIGVKAFRMTGQRKEFFLVSCYHVLCLPELKQRKKLLLESETTKSPSVVERTTTSSLHGQHLGKVAAGIFNLVNDSAIARLNDPEILADGDDQIGTPSEVYRPVAGDEQRLKIKMKGLSGIKRGVVVAVSSTQTILYKGANISDDKQKLIKVKFEPELQPGDSGSAVLDDKNRFIGIVTGKDNTAGYLIPADICLNAFDLKIN